MSDDQPTGHYAAGRVVAALYLLAERPRSAVELARELHVSQRTAQRLTARLVDDRLAEPVPHPSESRFRVSHKGHSLGFLLVTSALRELVRDDSKLRPLLQRRDDVPPPKEKIADPVKQVGLNIHVRRKELGLTIEEAGSKIGMDISYWSRLEHGKVDPGVRTLTRVATALETTPAALLTKAQSGRRDGAEAAQRSR